LERGQTLSTRKKKRSIREKLKGGGKLRADAEGSLQSDTRGKRARALKVASPQWKAVFGRSNRKRTESGRKIGPVRGGIKKRLTTVTQSCGKPRKNKKGRK